MLDILGREVNRGDIIVYGSKQRCSQFLNYAETKFGVVINVIPKGRKYKLKANQTSTGQSAEVETYIDKASFHDLEKARMIGPNSSRWKNGKPKIGNVILISTCLKINIEDLDNKSRAAYDIFKAEFQL